MAAISGAGLRKKVRYPWLGGPRRLTMYLATLDCATSNSSEQFAVNAWRTPKRVFDVHPPDQRAQLGVDPRSPSLGARLPTPVTAKAGPVPVTSTVQLHRTESAPRGFIETPRIFTENAG
jgi:hypothetical protein